MTSIYTDPKLRETQREYVDILEGEDLRESIDSLSANRKTRFLININYLRRVAPERCLTLINNGFEELICFQRALKHVVSSRDPTYSKEVEEFDIGFTG
ncbi:hypothetical protein GJ496_010626, partial [Pomphorhynchus laevis]